VTRVLLDTNVVLDFLLDRVPFADAAAALWQANDVGEITAYVSAITPINVFYIARKLREGWTKHKIGVVSRRELTALGAARGEDGT
jgi:predicted nucleic acid-binding protein